MHQKKKKKATSIVNVRHVWDMGKEATERVTFSLKASLAVFLVSILILIRAPYDALGSNVIWSILTVAIMFEETVGATINRGLNQAVGSLLAGVIAIAVLQVAMACGETAEPYIVGFSVFVIGAVTSFMKQWPSMVPYEDSFRVTLFTYCLVIISGHRMGNPINTAIDRLYSIAIGGIIAVLVNVLVFPIWAGEKLHRDLSNSFNAVADSLEAVIFFVAAQCVNKYLGEGSATQHEIDMITNDSEGKFEKCKEMLNSSTKFETLALSAKWEPPHGRFRRFFYPWSEYVKVGAALQHCSYELAALHGCLHSEVQAPYNLRCTLHAEILNAANQAAQLLRSLGKDINNMTRSRLQINLLKRVHISTEHLQHSIDMHFYLLTTGHDIHDCTAKTPPEKLSKTISFNFKEAESGSKNEKSNSPDAEPFQEDSFHKTMRKQHMRLYSWPSREVDDFNGGADTELIQKMHALESTAALSSATFTSLLIEFIARLDRLVEATDILAKMAKFK